MKTVTLTLCLCTLKGLTAQSPTDLAIFGSYPLTNIISNCAEACFGLANGLLVYTYADGKTYQFDAQNSGLLGSVRAVALDNAGNKWTVGSNGLYQITGNTVTKKQLLNEDLTPRQVLGMTRICIDAFNRIFISNYLGELYRYDPQTSICHVMPVVSTSYAPTLAKGADGIVYYASSYDDTIRIYQLTDFALLITTVNISEIDNHDFTSFLIDSESNFWLSFNYVYETGKDEEVLKDGGLAVFSKGTWTILPANNFEFDEALSGFANLILNGDQSIAAHYHTRFDQSKYVKLSIDENFHVPEIVDNDLALPYPVYIYRDEMGRDFFAMDGIMKYIDGNGETTIRPDRVDLSSKSMDVDDENTIWLADDRQIARIQNQDMQVFSVDGIAPADFVAKHISCAPDGKVWVSSENGILEFDGTALIFHDRAWANLDTCIDLIREIIVDTENTIWLQMGTYLMRKPESAGWEKINIPIIAGDYTIHNFEIYQGKLFAVSHSGVYVFNDSEWTVFDASNSPITEFMSIYYIEPDISGGAYVGSGESLFHLTEDSLYFITDLDMYRMTVDKQTGKLWYLNSTGIYYFVSADVQVQALIPNFSYTYDHGLVVDQNSNLIYAGPGMLNVHNPTGIIGYTEPSFNFPPNFSSDYCKDVVEDESSLLAVYPNPAAEQLVYYFQNDIGGDFSISIYSMQGDQILTQMGNALYQGVPYGVIDISSLPPGNYLAHVTSTGVSAATKFVKL